MKNLLLAVIIGSSAQGPATPPAGSVGTSAIVDGAVTAAKLASGAAASNIGYTPAHSGANSDITSLTGLSTPLAVNKGGTAATSASAARTSLGAATSGANSDITSLTGLTGAVTTTGVITAGSGPTIITNASGTLKSSALDVTLSGSNTGDVTLGAVGSSPNANGASLSSQVLTLQPADASNPGIVTTGTQTIAGNKTISGNLTINSLGLSASANINIPSGNSSLTFGVLGAKFTISSGFSENFAVFDTTAGVLGVSFPRNHGFAFATTLSPSGTTQTVDWATGSSQKIDAASTTGTLVLTFSDPMNGGRYILKTLGKSGRVWTFPSSVKWAGGVAPTVTATDGAKDMFEFFYDSGDSVYIGRIVAQNAS